MNANIEPPPDSQQRLLVPRPALQLSDQSNLDMQYDIEAAERELTLRDVWRILVRHIWVIVVITGVVTLAITVWLVLKPDYYEAEARVEIGLESQNPQPNEDDTRNRVTTADPAYFSTQLQLIKSPIVLSRVINALNLDHDPIHEHFVSRGGRKLRKLLRLSFLAPEDKILKTERDAIPLDTGLYPAISANDLAELARLQPYIQDLKNKVTVEPVREQKALFKDTRLVSILVDHPSPVLAAKIANGIADALVLQNEDLKGQASQVTNKYLVHRVGELRGEIRDDEISLARYSSQHQILSLDPAQNTAVDRLTSLNRQLVEAENARKLAEANYIEGKEPDAAAALAESEAKQIADAQSKLADLRQKKAQLLTSTTEQWPEVQEINQQIAALENFITDTRSRDAAVRIKNLETKYRQEAAHEKAIRAAFQQQRAVTETQDNAAVEYRLLQQQIESKKSLLNGYLKRFGENDVAQAAMTNNIRVVDYAPLPKRGEPNGPLRLLWVALAFIMSLSFSIGVTFVLEYLDDSLRTAAEVKDVLQLRAVGIIPSVSRSPHTRASLPTPINLRLTGQKPGRESLLLWEKNANLLLMEAYRRLRVSIFLSMQKPPKSILVASSLIGEGKTTTVANLAYSLAQTRASVLLIDGDMHRKHASELVKAEKLPGLGDLLSGSAVGSAELMRAVIKHESGVSVLPAGKSNMGQTEELLESATMRALLAISEANFDYVVIDSPAITACSDAVVLAKIVDAVLLVVHAGKSSREIVRYSQELVSEAGAQVLGVVLNRLPAAQYRTVYGQYYLNYAQVYCSRSSSLPNRAPVSDPNGDALNARNS